VANWQCNPIAHLCFMKPKRISGLNNNLQPSKDFRFDLIFRA